jgi:hypothetical protein
MLAALTAIVVAVSSTGAEVRLSQETGPCVQGAHLAEWVSPDAQQRVPGCWRLAGEIVEIGFLDGDSLRVPAAAFKPVQGL